MTEPLIRDWVFPTNLITPLGEITVLVDGKPYEYTARPFTYDKPPVVDQPLSGCYRIYVPVADCAEIVCKLIPCVDGIEEGAESGGEDYVCNSFERQNVELVIGMAEDYSRKCPRFDSACIPQGVRYSNFNNCDTVVFGLAWATDYFGDDDCRAWFAADPTMDNS
ncbi:MAG: hypothetical protein IJX47_03480 [Clostridia bacterium]|nr:hypothetical protein [Clostridia bacterium]